MAPVTSTHRDALTGSAAALRGFLAPSLRGYRRSYAGPDALAAVTLLVIAVPEQLATSRLAGMPPITGLYTGLLPVIAFALLGSSRKLVVS